MDEVDARVALERLARERGDDFAALSRLIGRNAAYIQQFIKRGTPKRLAEDDRRILAEYFQVDESLLGAPTTQHDRKNPLYAPSSTFDLVTISQFAVEASAGSGAVAVDGEALSHIAFPKRWLRKLAGGDPALLSIITVSGDSMEPTLSDGDEILVSAGDGADRLRDGIYVLRLDSALMVKRIAINPVSRTVTIKSDNDGYPDWPDCDLESLEIVGRVIWAGHRLA